MKIMFKSTPKNWEKERSGVKPNTLRRVDFTDERFDAGAEDLITIRNSETGEEFTRTLTDVTFYQEWAIFSWRHEHE